MKGMISSSTPSDAAGAPTPSGQRDPRSPVLVVDNTLPALQRDLGAWMSLYGPRLRAFFRKRASDADVDDLVQDVFVRLQELPDGTVVMDAERYVFTVARNVLIARYRANVVRIRNLADYCRRDEGAVDGLSPERIAIGRDEYSRALKAILGLPPRARAAFQFHRFEDMSYREIAERMGISKESVKELMHRAIVHMARAMEDAE